MEKECIINLRETLHDGAVRGKLVATLNERADDIEAHLDRLRAVENIRGHERAKLGEGVGTQPWITMLLRTGRNLRPVEPLRLRYGRNLRS